MCCRIHRYSKMSSKKPDSWLCAHKPSVLGTFKAGRISHLASRISHVISLYNIDLKDRLERVSRLIIFANYLHNPIKTTEERSHRFILTRWQLKTFFSPPENLKEHTLNVQQDLEIMALLHKFFEQQIY